MLADEEQIIKSLPSYASLDDQDRQHAPPTIAAATCIAPLAINKELLSTSKSRTPSLFFLTERRLVLRVYIFYISVTTNTTILSIQ
jgi:hypothetical protein